MENAFSFSPIISVVYIICNSNNSKYVIEKNKIIKIK